MTKRDKNGRYQRSENGENICRVYLADGSVEDMKKIEMYKLADKENKKIILQNGEYFIVEEVVYRAVMRPEWREAKRKIRNKRAIEKMNEVSSEKKATRKVVEIPVGDYFDCVEYKAKWMDNSEDILHTEKLLVALNEALDTLSERDREIMDMCSNKYTDAAIGKEIGMSQRGVNKRKKVLLEKLKEILEKIL